jgi:formamidopyrimidine-DNA glycosylase
LVSVEELPPARPEWAELGTDTVDEPISWTAFGRALLDRPERLKLLLMDPTFLVGLGRVYSDEILFHAGLRYNRTSDSLSTQEIRRLYRAVVEVVHDAVKYRGTTLEENGYADLFGEPGAYQDHLTVYGKAGEMSARARGEIVRSKIGGQWTYYCEQTQV